MDERDALLSAIVADPCEDTGWLALADWLDENDDEPRRGELIRLHRKLLATCCEAVSQAAWEFTLHIVHDTEV